MDNFIHTLRRFRIAQTIMMLFIMWITYDFHMYLKTHLLEMKEFQVAAVVAYPIALIGVVKYMFESITHKIERDDP